MAMLHDLIQESRYQIPSKAKRIRLRSAYESEFCQGVPNSREWRETSLDLLEELDDNISRRSPTYQEESIEQIMWRHDIQLVMMNINVITEELRGTRWMVLKKIGSIVFTVLNGGMFNPMLPTDMIMKPALRRRWEEATNRIHAEARQELARIGVYYCPD